MRHDFRLLMNFLGHEVAEIAFLDQEGGGARAENGAFHLAAARVVNLRAAALEHCEVAVIEIGDDRGERRERDRIGAEHHLALAIADGERRALPRADKKILLALEQKGECEGPLEARQGGFHRRDGIEPCLHEVGDEMGDRFRVGLSHEVRAPPRQFGSQLVEILDDAVVNDGDAVGRMRMRIDLVGPAMRRPARMADADRAIQGLPRETLLQVPQLAFGTQTGQMPVLERGEAGRVITAIFKPLERVDQRRRNRLMTENPDNSAHEACESFSGAVRDTARCGSFDYSRTAQERAHIAATVQHESGHPGFFLTAAWMRSRQRATQPSRMIWRPRPSPRLPAGTSSVMTDPEPI